MSIPSLSLSGIPSTAKTALPIFTPRKTPRNPHPEDGAFLRLCCSILLLVGGGTATVISWPQLTDYEVSKPGSNFIEGQCRIDAMRHTALTTSETPPGAGPEATKVIGCTDTHFYTFVWLGAGGGEQLTATESIRRAASGSCEEVASITAPTITSSPARCWAARPGADPSRFYPSCSSPSCVVLLPSPEDEFGKHANPLTYLVIGLVAFVGGAVYTFAALCKARPAPPGTPRGAPLV